MKRDVLLGRAILETVLFVGIVLFRVDHLMAWRKQLAGVASRFNNRLFSTNTSTNTLGDEKKAEQPEMSGSRKLAGDPANWQYGTTPGYPSLPKFAKQHSDTLATLSLFVKASTRSFELLEAELATRFHKHQLETLEDFASILDLTNLPAPLPSIPPPQILPRWREDVIFSDHFLNGVNPMVIQRALATDGLPQALTTPTAAWEKNETKINTWLATKEKDAGCTLSKLIKDGHIYFADYQILQGLKPYPGCVFYAPIALFYRSQTTGKFMPLAIQLDRQTAQEGQDPRTVGVNELFLPPHGDAGQDPVVQREWLFAKMHVMHADALVHENLSHLGFIHLPMETIVIAAHRCFDSKHLLFEALLIHFYGTVAINNHARDKLISKGTFFDRQIGTGVDSTLLMIEIGYRQHWRLMERGFPKETAKRGFKFEGDALSDYHYLEDGAKVWKCIDDYAKALTAALYHDDASVQNDAQLQSFTQELRDTSENGADIPGAPTVRTVSDVQELVANIIWIASAQHAAVNFGQYNSYAYVPFRPLAMRHWMPYPDDRKTAFADDKYIVQSLNTSASLIYEILKTAWILVLPTDDALLKQGLSLGTRLLDAQFHHSVPGVIDAWKAFQTRMELVETGIRKRNEGLVQAGEIAYEYLIPSEIPRSVAI